MTSFKQGKVAAAACLIATVAPAQDSGGNLVTFGVSQNLSYSNNLDFDAAENAGVRSVTGLTFGYSSETRFERLNFSASTNASFSNDSGDENGFTSPQLRLSYARIAKSAELTASASFRQAEVSSIVGTDDIVDGGFFTVDSGEQRDIGYSVGLELGKTAPLGATFTYSGNNRVYTNTSDTSLLNTDRHDLSGQIRLTFDDRITGRLIGRYTEYNEEGGISRTTSAFGAGVNLAVTKTLSVDASLTYDETERVENGTITRVFGPTYSMGVTQGLKDGALTADLTSRQNENGRRTTFNLGREMELKNGSLTLSFGAVIDDDSNINPLYGFSYAQALRGDASFNVQASQAFETNGAGDEAINTRIGMSYAQPLTKVSSLSATANYRATSGFETTGDDASRLDLGVTYNHQLAQDWGLVGGYTRSFATEDGEADRTADTVFVGLQKNFQWRP